MPKETVKQTIKEIEDKIIDLSQESLFTPNLADVIRSDLRKEAIEWTIILESLRKSDRSQED